MSLPAAWTLRFRASVPSAVAAAALEVLMKSRRLMGDELLMVVPAVCG